MAPLIGWKYPKIYIVPVQHGKKIVKVLYHSLADNFNRIFFGVREEY